MATENPPYRVWALIDGDWKPRDCKSVKEVKKARILATEAGGATHTVVSVPGEPEYDGDMQIINGHIVMGRM